MRQVWITKAGPPEVLQVREAPDPEPAEGQARIRVKAAGINFADLMARVGLYPDAPKIPCVVGYEVSGTIDAVGPVVTSRKVGDRVFGMPKFGGYSDCVALNEAQIIKMPAAMSLSSGLGRSSKRPCKVRQYPRLSRIWARAVLGSSGMSPRARSYSSQACSTKLSARSVSPMRLWLDASH